MDKATFTGEMHGLKVTAEYDNDDITMEDALQSFKGIAISLGYHIDSWKGAVLDMADEYRKEEPAEEEEESELHEKIYTAIRRVLEGYAKIEKTADSDYYARLVIFNDAMRSVLSILTDSPEGTMYDDRIEALMYTHNII